METQIDIVDYLLYFMIFAVFLAMIFDLVMTFVSYKSKSNRKKKEKLEQQIDTISHTLVFSQLLVDGTKERFALFLSESQEARAEGDKEKELAAISKFHSYLHEWSKVLESRKQEYEAVLVKT